MSIEPKCDFCDTYSNLRCRTLSDAYKCKFFKGKNKMEKEKVENQVETLTKQLVDLAMRQSRSVVAVIDALSVRGSFKGEELSTIGMLREQSTQISSLSERLQAELVK